jgi:hypothetical protein
VIAADRFTGDIVQALAKAGLFRLRGVLSGTVAFQCYSAYLGIRLPFAAIRTGDADLAQDFAISAEVADSLPPILDLLKGLDPTFRAHIIGSCRSHAFRKQSGYRVEFMTTNRGAKNIRTNQPTCPLSAARQPNR